MDKILKVALFFNNYRGLKTLNFLNKKKNLKIKYIFLAKKNLNKKIILDLKSRNIKFFIIKNVNDYKILKKIKNNQTDLNILCGFPYILNKEMIYSAKKGTINLHGGMLPKYRGGSPLNWQIINGEKFVGISIVKISEGIDTGEIISEKKFKLKNTFNIKKVHDIANKLFPPLTYNAIQKLLKKKNFKKINLKISKYYRQRKQNDGKINWKVMSSKQVYNLIRACSKPYPGAFTCNSKDKKIIIFDSVLTNIRNKNLKLGEVKKIKRSYFIKSKSKMIKVVSYKGSLLNGEILH